MENFHCPLHCYVRNSYFSESSSVLSGTLWACVCLCSGVGGWVYYAWLLSKSSLVWIFLFITGSNTWTSRFVDVHIRLLKPDEWSHSRIPFIYLLKCINNEKAARDYTMYWHIFRWEKVQRERERLKRGVVMGLIWLSPWAHSRSLPSQCGSIAFELWLPQQQPYQIHRYTLSTADQYPTCTREIT